MTPPQAPLIDPDLEQVLEDLAQQKRTTLFAFDHRKLLYGLRDGSIQARSTQVGLLPVERHLLDVHRYEVAWLLREAFLREYRSRPAGKAAVYRRDVISRTEWKARATQGFSSFVEPEVLPAAADALLGELHGDSENSPDQYAILAASLRLQDAPHARAYQAVYLKNNEQRRTALYLATQLVNSRPPGDVAGSALQAVAAIRADTENYRVAERLYRRAYSVYLEHDLGASYACVPICNLLSLAIRRGRDDLALEASQLLDDNVSAGDVCIQATARAVSEQSRGHGFAEEGRTLMSRLRETSGTPTREFIDALQ